MKWSHIALGAAALYLIARPRAAVAAPAPADNLSAIAPPMTYGNPWDLTAPVDSTVAPSGRTGETNPLSTWLENTFGIRVPQIGPLAITENASSPLIQGTPAAPAGDWLNGSLGMPAVPGTWTPSTSQALPPGFMNLSDPNLAMIVMPWGDDVIYVPDPVMF